jgi:16S rRNA G1207 methylase RsmC
MVVEHRSGVGLKNKLGASRMFAVAARTVHRGGGLRVAISPQLPLEKILKLHMEKVMNDSDFAL